LACAPFLLDELDARTLLAGLVPAPIQVDNDVNWAALAEDHHGGAESLANVVYCYLGPGIGSAVLVDGKVVHGARGLAGELAHVRTVGPGDRSMALIECFAGWGLVQPGTQAIEVDQLLAVLAGRAAAARRRRDAVVRAVAGALASVTALLNPERVLIGGPRGTAYDFDQLVAARLHETAIIDTAVGPAQLGASAPLAGARIEAVRSAQAWLRNRGRVA
jgi:predicted NBD/HSP70 family sugar kinase